MLLTSAQASLAVSSFIVFFFTTALFLSGYVLQQQTVRDLRAAIQPQLVRVSPPKGPDLYLPPQFKDDERYKNKGIVDAIVEDTPVETKNQQDGGAVEGEGDMVGATRWQKAARRKKVMEEANAKLEGQKPLVEEKEEGMEKEEESAKPKEIEKPLSAAERRRRIKEQILAEGEGEGFKGYRRRMW